ncbi:hypothetical protein I3842_01G025600 [Carya illinoinensis]|uniref:RPW8 domain-containing protein n=1 Tax=Carya illinoinensis TaxID=32201 RepID=A0A922G169_CARIL|nr:hypothetical protein I3842_01G025600 [Carya illinoinensis]
MASVVVANAALGGAFERVFSLLYEAITDVINKTRTYESILERLKDRLDLMRPLVNEMVLSNRERDLSEERTKRLIERMVKGEKRVRKYSQLSWWKYLMRFHYAKKLIQLEKELSGFFKVELPAWNAMNVLDVLESVRGIKDISQRLSLTRLNSVPSCVVPRLRTDFVMRNAGCTRRWGHGAYTGPTWILMKQCVLSSIGVRRKAAPCLQIIQKFFPP